MTMFDPKKLTPAFTPQHLTAEDLAAAAEKARSAATAKLEQTRIDRIMQGGALTALQASGVGSLILRNAEMGLCGASLSEAVAAAAVDATEAFIAAFAPPSKSVKLSDLITDVPAKE